MEPLNARHHARAAPDPRALEGGVRSAGRVSVGRVDDAVEVVANLSERVLRRFPLKVAQLMDTAALDRGPGPHEAAGASQPGVAVDDAE